MYGFREEWYFEWESTFGLLGRKIYYCLTFVSSLVSFDEFWQVTSLLFVEKKINDNVN